MIDIKVISMTGRVFIEKKEKAVQELTVIPFDLTTLPKGIYLMQVEQEGRRTTRKIVLR